MTTRNHFWRDVRMPYVETRRACASRVCYQAHSHTTFSIGAVDQGLSRFYSHHTGAEIISAQSLVFMPANVVHHCNPMPEQQWSYQMMHLDAAWLNTLLKEYQINYANTEQQLIAQHQAQVVHNVDLYHKFTQLNEYLFDQETSIAEKEQYMIELLLPLFRLSGDLEEVFDHKQQHQHWLTLLQWLAECDDFVSLEVLAAQLKISRFALIRLFKQQTGLAPHAYQINLRINQARELLCKGRSLADVAFSLGFCDQSHFHRCFKAYTGITPKQYQQRL